MGEKTSNSQISGPHKLLAIAKKVAFATTGGDDLNPHDNADVRKAMYAYRAFRAGEPVPENLSNKACEFYQILRDMQIQLAVVDRDIMQGQDQVPQGATKFLRRQSQKVMKRLALFAKSSSPFVRSSWTVTLAVSLGWQSTIAAMGADRSFVPLTFPTVVRSVFIFLDWVSNPLANSYQLGNMSAQRLILPAPNNILYTLTLFNHFKEGFYGNKAYDWINNSVSVAFVVAFILWTEVPEFRDRHDIEGSIKLMTSPDDRQAERNEELPKQLKTTLRLMEALAERARERQIKGSHGTEAEIGSLMNDWNKMIIGLTAFVKGRVPEQEDPDWEEKWATVANGALLTGIKLGASYRNPAAFTAILSWAISFLYRLIKSATNKGHRARQTQHVFSQAGAITLPMVFLISIPLLGWGPDVFDNEKLLKGSTITLCLIAAFAIHRLGPLVLPIGVFVMRPLIRLIVTIGRQTTKAGEAFSEWRAARTEKAAVTAITDAPLANASAIFMKAAE
ncbi:hypothetical protein BDR04DRAFT_1094428 [Suillus decipiens]|nr:hypothetical protein BDR04DRAFT_1094428 [Suillus decipiens]